MAFTISVTKRGVIGDMKYVKGVYTSADGSTGGDITTGLNHVDDIYLQGKGSSAIGDSVAVNETMPLASGDVTIVTASNEIGTFFAMGR